MVSSQGEEKVSEFLEEVLPVVRVEKQYYVNYKGHKLYFDFYIHSYKLMIEVQGLQHYQFVEFFHGDNDGWKMHKARDVLKYEWAEEAGVKILELNDKNFPKNASELLDRMLEAVDDGTT